MTGERRLADASELLEEIETSFPVDEWTVDGTRAWPFVRTRLGYGFVNEAAGVDMPTADVGWRAIAREAGRAVGAAPRISAVVARSRSGWRALGDLDAMFLSDGGSFARTAAGTYVERHCDPLRRAIGKRGHASCLLVPGHEMPAPLLPPVVYVQPRLDVARARARLRPTRRARLEGYDGVRRLLSRRGLDRYLPSSRVIEYALAGIHGCAAVFGRFLRDRSVRVGLVVGYYSLQSMAFVLACRAAGIPSIDLQHGLQGRLHFAYGRWRRVPRDGYELLPRYFWVWSREEAAAIEEWSDAVLGHDAIVGGNPLMLDWCDGRLRTDEFTDGAVSVVERARSAHRTVLWTLHGWETSAELHRLVAVVAASPKDWFWWLRAHPLHLDRVPDLVAELRRLDVRNAEAVEASRLPLFGLLQHVDVHVTEYSSVVLDAERFGVYSVVVHPVGAEIYADRIEAGSVLFAPINGAHLFDALASQAQRRSARAVVEVERDLPGLPWLLTLLEKPSPPAPVPNT